MIQGLITNIGIEKSREATNNTGFQIIPTRFSLSNVQSSLDPNRVGPNSGVWYQSPISSRIPVSYNTVKFICSVPPKQINDGELQQIREIYIFCELGGVEFLFAIGQPSPSIQYDPSGSVTLDLDVSLTNADLSSIIVFQYTQATELAEHITDPNSHPELIKEMNNAGMYLEAGGKPFTYRGQWYDKKAEFGGTRASFVRGGITFRARYTGPDYNGLVVTFDGSKTVDQVMLEFNAANPNNQITHNSPTGTEILASGSGTLTGGTVTVATNHIVYKDIDGLYKKAIADGTIRSKVVGIADVERRIVHSHGFFNMITGYAVGDDVYLSDLEEGGLKNVPTGIKIGTVMRTDMILMSAIGGISGLLAQTYDAIVSSAPGFKYYPTTQLAIDNVPDGGKILVDKMETVVYEINSANKNLQFTFNGPNTGWMKSAGLQEQQRILFSAIPMSGTWRIEWNGQIGPDMSYNATASQIETIFNGFTGHNGVMVSGDYASGFTIQFNDYVQLPRPLFTDPGQNEIQRIDYSATPDDGTIRLSYDGEQTANIAWNDPSLLVKSYIEALSNVSSISLTGSFNDRYHQIEFVDTDGLMNKLLFDVAANTLKSSGSVVNTNINVLQEGRLPASNLKNGSNNISITVIETIIGTPIGPDTAFKATADRCSFKGLGRIRNFITGIDLQGHTGSRIEMYFDNILHPVSAAGLVPGIDYNAVGSIGVQEDVFAQLKLLEHKTLKKRVKISGSDVKLANSGLMGQEFNKLLVKFDGAEIDFETGTIYAADGTTVVGINFTPANIANNKYRYYSITLVQKLQTSDNRMQLQCLVIPASQDGITLEDAPRAIFAGSGIKLGQVCVKGTTTGISNITQDYILQLGTSSGGGSSSGSFGSFNSYMLHLTTSSLEFNGGVFSWDQPIYIVNQFYGRYLLPVGSISGVADGEILYVKAYQPDKAVSSGTALGNIGLFDTAKYNIGDEVIVGDADSNQTYGVVNTITGSVLNITDSIGGNAVDLSNFTSISGAWVMKRSVTLYKGTPNNGDLKPDSFGNINDSIYFIGICVNNSLFLSNGVELTKSWVYEESLLVTSNINPGDEIVLPVDSRNSNAVKKYKVGIGDLEVSLNGLGLDRSKVYLTGLFDALSYDSGSFELSIPDSVDLSIVKRHDILVDGLGNEYVITGKVFDVTGGKKLSLDSAPSVSLTSCQIYSQGYSELGMPNQMSNKIISRTLIPVGNILKFRINPFLTKSSPSGDMTVGINLGSGLAVFKEKIANEMRFRNIKAGNGINVTIVGNDIVITNTGDTSGGGTNASYFVDYVTNIIGSVMNSSMYDTNGELELYRNGILMHNGALGNNEDRYSETSNTSITLASASTADEIYTIVNNHNMLPDRSIVAGNGSMIISVPNYIIGSNKLMLFRNGILMNSQGLGDAIDRYTESSATSVTLSVAGGMDEVFVALVLPNSPVFRLDITGSTDNVISLPSSINVGNKRLFVYRNGVLMMNSNSMGSTVERYLETNTNEITLAMALTADEVITIIYK